MRPFDWDNAFAVPFSAFSVPFSAFSVPDHAFSYCTPECLRRAHADGHRAASVYKLFAVLVHRSVNVAQTPTKRTLALVCFPSLGAVLRVRICDQERPTEKSQRGTAPALSRAVASPPARATTTRT